MVIDMTSPQERANVLQLIANASAAKVAMANGVIRRAVEDLAWRVEYWHRDVRHGRTIERERVAFVERHAAEAADEQCAVELAVAALKAGLLTDTHGRYVPGRGTASAH